jgi:hypothetical protein
LQLKAVNYRQTQYSHLFMIDEKPNKNAGRSKYISTF